MKHFMAGTLAYQPRCLETVKNKTHNPGRGVSYFMYFINLI